MNDEQIRGYTQNCPIYSESHIIGEVLDVGTVRKLYVMSSTSAEEYRQCRVSLWKINNKPEGNFRVDIVTAILGLS